MESPFQGLPEEIVLKIFKELTFAERRSIVPLVCKEWHQLTERTTDLWTSVTFDDVEEDTVFQILDRADLTGGFNVNDANVKRVPVLHWFRKHSAVISTVTLHLENSFEEGPFGLEEEGLRGGGLTAALIGVKETLTHLTMNADWIKAKPYFSDLLWLTNLIYLELESFDGETAADMEGLANLTNLQTLKLRGSGDAAVLPESLFHLTQLRVLDISWLVLDGFVEGFSLLVNLSELYLSEVGARGTEVAEHIAMLSDLATLELSRSSVDAFPSIAQLTLLKDLIIYGNSLVEFPQGVSGCVNLNMDSNSLTTLPDMRHFRFLRVLSCCFNLFSEFPATSLAVSESIEVLNFNYCNKMTIARDVAELSRMPQLVSLGLRGFKTSPAGMVGLFGLVEACQSLGVNIVVKAQRVEDCFFRGRLADGCQAPGRLLEISV